MKEYLYIIFGIVLAVIFGFFIGFFIGRKTDRVVTKTEYIKGETITDTLHIPYPVREEVPVYYSLPVRYDTVYIDNYIYVRGTVDTAAIISEYIVERSYALDVFDNEHGKLTADVALQYNKLRHFGYSFTPVSKVSTVQVKRIWQPFVSASYSTFGIVGIGGGIYYNQLGVEYQIQHSFIGEGSGHLFGLKWKI